MNLARLLLEDIGWFPTICSSKKAAMNNLVPKSNVETFL